MIVWYQVIGKVVMRGEGAENKGNVCYVCACEMAELSWSPSSVLEMYRYVTGWPVRILGREEGENAIG